MKKFTLIAILSVLAMPAYATDTVTDDDVTPTTDDVVATAPDTTPDDMADVAPDVTNPDIKFPHGLQIGVGVSATSGLNGFVGYANKNFDSFWWKRFGVRFDFATTAPLKSVISSGIDSIMGDGIELGDGLSVTDGSIQANHFAALVDFYPFGNTWFLGGLRISGGYYFGNLELSARLAGTIDGAPEDALSFELDGQEYKYSGNQMNAMARADWDYRGPYLGAGFDLGLFAGFKIYFDAGVVFTNRAAQLGLDVPPDNLMVRGDDGQWAPVQGGLVGAFEQAKHNALADAQEELDKLTFYPMVKLGFMYRF